MSTSTSGTTDAMERYFEELLQAPTALQARGVNEAGGASIRRSHPSAQPLAKKQERSRVTLNEIKTLQVNTSTLQSLQKQKLQALLDQQHQLDVKSVETTRRHEGPETRVPKTTTAEETVPQSIETSVPSLLCWHKNGRPLWAQEAFDVLLFEVSGLTLAVPLFALGQIQRIGDTLTPIFGQSDWFMGLLNTPQGAIKTVNTALFVMPEKYNDTFLERARFVVSIDGLAWGLAVDTVNQPSRIHPSDVKWRTDRSKRPWLAGTVKSAMCALIDIPQMGKILSESEK